MRLQKRLRELLRRLQPVCCELGAEIIDVELRGSGHYRITVDFGGGASGYLTVANSPSDHRTIANVCRDLKREATTRRAS